MEIRPQDRNSRWLRVASRRKGGNARGSVENSPYREQALRCVMDMPPGSVLRVASNQVLTVVPSINTCNTITESM